MALDNFEKIKEYHGIRRANQLLNISLRHKYVWFKNAKVASSTLSKTLQKLETLDLPFLPTPPHPAINSSVHVKPYQLPPEDLERMLVGDDFFRFTFVRNPYVRVVSAYKDKILKGEPEKVFILRKMGLPKDALDAEISFEQFVATILDSDRSDLDQHWAPQKLMTCAEWTNHHFVGKIENFQEDFAALGKHLGVDLGEFYHYHAPHRSNADQTFREFYKSDEIRQMVADYFAEDFELYGYSKDLV